MSNFTDNPVDLDDSLACEPGGNQLVKKKKHAAHLTTYELMEIFDKDVIKRKKIAHILQNVTNDIVKEMEELVKKGILPKTKDDNITAWDINCGLCEEWTMLAIEKLKYGHELWIDDVGYDKSHCVLVIDGRYYDSQHPYGVDKIDDLDVVRCVSRQNFLNNLMEMKSLEKVIFEMILESRWNLPDFDDYSGDSFEEYYDRPIEKERLEMEEKQGNLYYGRNVIWIGESGRMVKIPASEVTPREDNIFDFAKVKAVKEHIENSEERIYFDAPLAQVVVVDFQTIKEMQKSFHSERFHIDYNINEPFSLGDEDLDLFLGSPESWQEENGINSYDDVLLFMKEPKKWLEDWSYDGNPNEWTEDEKQDYKYMLEDVEGLKNIKEKINQAIEDGDGDIGEYWVDLRDGNHRAFGAIASGEPYIWAIAVKDRTDSSIDLQ